MSYRLALFDLDGTLFDTRKVNYLAYKEAMNGYDLDYDYYCTNCNGRNYLQFLPEIIPGIARGDMEIIHEAKKTAYPRYLEYAILNEELLLRKAQINAVVTTASRKNTNDILNYFNICSEFDFIITKEDVINTKPDPECLFLALEKAGVKANDAIVFEDSKEGVEAARRAGIFCELVTGYR